MEYGLGIMKILSMMTGGIGNDELFPADSENNGSAKWVAAKIWCVIFMVTVTILLSNLLVGWTITEMKVFYYAFLSLVGV